MHRWLCAYSDVRGNLMYADKLCDSPSAGCLIPGPTGMREFDRPRPRARRHNSTSPSRASKESEPSNT